MVREITLSEPMRDSGIFDVTFMKNLLAQHSSGVRDNSAPIWSLMMFASFLTANEVSIEGRSGG